MMDNSKREEETNDTPKEKSHNVEATNRLPVSFSIVEGRIHFFFTVHHFLIIRVSPMPTLIRCSLKANKF